MPEPVAAEREVRAPAETVWAMIADVTRMGEWSPENVGGEWRRGATGPSVGARFRGRNRRGWRRWSTSCTVVECDPGRRFAFDVSAVGVTVSRWSYELEPTATGCRVVERWTDRRPRWMVGPARVVMGVPDMAVHNRAGIEETLKRVAAAAERGGA
jgi:hypothetical protein